MLTNDVKTFGPTNWCFVLPVIMPCSDKSSLQIYLSEDAGMYRMVGYSIDRFHFTPNTRGHSGNDFGKVVFPKGKTIDKLVDGDVIHVVDQFGVPEALDGVRYSSRLNALSHLSESIIEHGLCSSSNKKSLHSGPSHSFLKSSYKRKNPHRYFL